MGTAETSSHPDTHGADGSPWYGFDLDGTLAVYDKWEGIDHIGAPVRPMVDLIRKMHAEGKVVKILTARVAPRSDTEVRPTPYPLYADSYEGADDGDVPEYAARAELGSSPERQMALAFYAKREWIARYFIADWCLKNLGFLPEITHEKDHLMVTLYDDRVKQVIPNKGVLMEDVAVRETTRRIELELCSPSSIGRFMLGLVVGFLLVFLIAFGFRAWDCRHRTPAAQALDDLNRSGIESQGALEPAVKR